VKSARSNFRALSGVHVVRRDGAGWRYRCDASAGGNAGAPNLPGETHKRSRAAKSNAVTRRLGE